MSNLNPAANPAQSPRAKSAKITEYVCTGTELAKSDCALLDCNACPYYKPVPDWIQSYPEAVKEAVEKSFKCSLCDRITWDWGKNFCPDCGSIFCWDCYQAGASHHCDLVTEPAANPAQSPRAKSAKPTYVCINPDGVCDLNCCKCPYFVPESETVSMRPSPRPKERKSPQVVLTRTNYITLHKFQSWDQVDHEFTKWLKDHPVLGNIRSFDILAWSFEDSPHWYPELHTVPVGCWVKVKWQIGCKVEAVEAVEAVDPNYPQPLISLNRINHLNHLNFLCKKCENPLAVDIVGSPYCPRCWTGDSHSDFGWCDNCSTNLIKDRRIGRVYCPHCESIGLLHAEHDRLLKFNKPLGATV